MDKNVTASITKHRRTTLERIEKYISDKYFTDVNLFGKLYPHRKDVTSISHWPVPGGEGSWEEWGVESVLKQKFVPAKVGDQFGPVWSTHWFKVSFSIPDEWKGLEIRLRWKSQSEAMVWDLNGVPLQGLSTGTDHQVRTDFRISGNYELNVEEKEQTFLIEMACSRMFGVGKGGMINPPNLSEMFTLELVELCVFDVDIHSLIIDLECLHDLASNLSEDQRGYRALYAGNQMVNELIAGKVGRAKEVSQEFFSRGNGESSITLALIGNCHIDSAWLWPYSETKRKCARSWAATLRLMEDYPEMIFACSQAQQFEWTKEYYPHLYDQIKEKSLQGKFMHVGATWVEMDGLVPSGESFVRQFLYGQKFYLEEFGSESNIFWLPDTFGYSAQIPQICKHFEIPYFLTQKLSWSLVNKFPNHTFTWEGIDGSSILAHFPPGDSYEMNVTVKEALKSEQNLRDKGRVSVVGFLYGFGDGGGGPTQDMLERARRLANVDGCPRMKHMTPLEMFRRMESEEQNYCRWIGELYLELHNGTYTSQAKTKAYNRKCEFMLRNSEILLSILVSFKLGTTEEIKELRGKCESAWKKVLLNQFHDVLPGSSIGIVYEDSDRLYEEAIKIGEDVSGFCIKKLSEDPASGQEKSLSMINFFPWLVGNDGGPEAKGSVSVLNLLPWPVSQIVQIEDSESLKGLDKSAVQEVSGNPGKKYIGIEAPPFSYTSLNLTSAQEKIPAEAKLLHPPSILVEKIGTDTILQNQFISARFTEYAQLTEFIDKKNRARNVFSNPRNGGPAYLKGNLITLYDDVPLFWDAWDVMDYHLETRSVLNSAANQKNIDPLKQVETGPLRVDLELNLSVGKKSSLKQRIVMTAVDSYLSFETEVDWKESHKFLKVEFETGLLARNATYEIQFGHLQRPTHQNTSWDTAQFEVCGHKWANISEFDFGLSVLNDSKYGWSCRGGTLALSLLRSPKAPDDNCDMGKQSFKYAAMPHEGSLQKSGTIQASYEFNAPLSLLHQTPLCGVSGWLEIEGEGVMVEAAKVAEEDERAVIVRLYEMFGSARSVWLKTGFPLAEARDCNGMERPGAVLPIFKVSLIDTADDTAEDTADDTEDDTEKQHAVHIRFHPFQIKTIMFVPA